MNGGQSLLALLIDDPDEQLGFQAEAEATVPVATPASDIDDLDAADDDDIDGAGEEEEDDLDLVWHASTK
jgi:hypothetical protein